MLNIKTFSTDASFFLRKNNQHQRSTHCIMYKDWIRKAREDCSKREAKHMTHTTTSVDGQYSFRDFILTVYMDT